MKNYLEQRLIDLKKLQTEIENKVSSPDVVYNSEWTPTLNRNLGAISETIEHLNYLNAQSETPKVGNNEGEKEVCKHCGGDYLETYKYCGGCGNDQ